MRNLLKADLKRAWKDKLFVVLCILAAVFAVSTPLLYKAIFSFMDMEELLEMGNCRTTPRFHRHREMRAFVSCMA